LRGIYCDLKKYLHYVNHDILLSKLELYGITGRDNVLYKSYPTDRYQSLLIYNKNCSYITLSNWQKLNMVFHNVLFLDTCFLYFIYVNDLLTTINNGAIPVLPVFAENTSILFTKYNKHIPTVFKLIRN
jgi:hypothetical protein